MEYKQPQYNARGGIDILLEHPKFGWINFTASPTDPEQFGRDVFEQVKLDPKIKPYLPPVVTPPTVEELRAAMPALTARQFRLGMRAMNVTTAMIDNAIATIPDPDQKEVAQIEWEYGTTFERSHKLVSQLSLMFGITPAMLDAGWMEAAKL